MLDLFVRWEPQGKKLSDKIVDGLRHAVEEKLSAIGYSGIWVVTPVKHANGRSLHSAFRYKLHKHRCGRNIIIAVCCCGVTDGCWELSITPPDRYDFMDVVAVLQDKQDEPKPVAAPKPAPKPSKPTILDALCKAQTDGKIFTAIVDGVLGHGLEIRLDDSDLAGFVPIECLDDKYDAANLERYSTGDRVKVCVADANGGRFPKFSIAAAKLLTGSDNVSHAFTGVPESDGKLRLAGYTKDFDRKIQTLKWIRDLAIITYPDPIPNDTVIDEVITELCKEYGASIVERKAVAQVIRALSITDKWLRRTGEGSVRGYEVTELGWATVGGEPEGKPEVATSAAAQHDGAEGWDMSLFLAYSAEMAQLMADKRKLEQRLLELAEWMGQYPTEIAEIRDRVKVETNAS